MPQPEDTFNVIRTQLQAVGLKIKPTADQWDPDYLEKIQGTAKHGIHLLGWTGDYNDTDNFLGVFFGAKSPSGLRQPAALRRAAGGPRPAHRGGAAAALREDQPGRHGVPAGRAAGAPGAVLAFSPDVQGYQPSPVQDEVWNTISLG